MATALAPFTLNNVSLTLIAADDEVGTPVEYRCQLSQAELIPAAAAGGGNSLQTFCDTFSEPPGLATWTLTLSGFQAFADAQDLSMFLFDHEGEKLTYVLTPMGGTISASNPGFTGDVTAVPTNIGGTAGQYGVFSGIAMPCVAKPDKLTAPPA